MQDPITTKLTAEELNARPDVKFEVSTNQLDVKLLTLEEEVEVVKGQRDQAVADRDDANVRISIAEQRLNVLGASLQALTIVKQDPTLLSK
jgi:hypothetical protein